jgi:hypothetical protein
MVLQNLSILKCFINKIDKDIQQIFLVLFSETIRECSYTKKIMSSNYIELNRKRFYDLIMMYLAFFNKLNKVY